MSVYRVPLLLLLLLICLGCEPAEDRFGAAPGGPATPPPDVKAPRIETGAETPDGGATDSSLSAIDAPSGDELLPPTPPKVKAIIRAAIEAHGGEANFAKANRGQTTMSIDGMLQPGMTGQFVKVDTFDLPGRHKRTVKGESRGQSFDMNYVLNGDNAWVQLNGGEPRSLPIVNPDTQGIYPGSNLNVLLTMLSPELRLALQPAEKIRGRMAHRLRLQQAGQWRGDSYFDQETHLIIAAKKELFDAVSGKTRSVETYYSGFKKVDGLTIPMSVEMVVDGETTMTMKITGIEFLTEVDEKIFAKPEATNKGAVP